MSVVDESVILGDIWKILTPLLSFWEIGMSHL